MGSRNYPNYLGSDSGREIAITRAKEQAARLKLRKSHEELKNQGTLSSLRGAIGGAVLLTLVGGGIAVGLHKVATLFSNKPSTIATSSTSEPDTKIQSSTVDTSSNEPDAGVSQKNDFLEQDDINPDDQDALNK